jgi:hypothetical protein
LQVDGLPPDLFREFARQFQKYSRVVGVQSAHQLSLLIVVETLEFGSCNIL